MYHSITIGNKNTWTDWHLIPTSRPVINPPDVNEKMVEVPGRQGLLDLTDALVGHQTFANRTGSWEFYVMHDYWNSWADCYSTIMGHIHGNRVRVVLEDDPGYSYEGRVSVSSWSSQKDYSKITINYNLDPFKTEDFTGHQIL